MLKSIRSRLIASYLLVILLAMGIAALLAWSALDRAFLDVLRENLVAQARRVAQTVEAGDMSDFETEPAPYSQAANVFSGYHTRVIDDEGVVILGLSATDVPIIGVEFQSDLSTYDELFSNLGFSRLDARDQNVSTDDLLRRWAGYSLGPAVSTDLRQQETPRSHPGYLDVNPQSGTR